MKKRRYLHPQGKRWFCYGERQAAPANEKGPWPAPWGPHCFLRQGRHTAPFNKRDGGAERRAARQVKQRQRAALLDSGPERDDGWNALGGAT